MSLEETHRVEKTKERLKALAVECHARLTHLIRLKIAWAITQYPRECFTAAHVTLNKKLAKKGDAPHKRWKTILARKSVEEAKKTLLSQKEKDQELNSCHPFGHALQIYEDHHPKRHHPRG